MNVKTVFLNSGLKEEIYMGQPERCVVPRQEHKVCKVVKSLYGLKQTSKQWYDKFDSTLISNGFKVNDSGACVYYNYDEHGCVIIYLYVDNMLIFCTNIDVLNTTKNFLKLSLVRKTWVKQM